MNGNDQIECTIGTRPEWKVVLVSGISPRVQLREAKETKRGCDEAGLLLRRCGLIPESCAVYA